MTRVRDARALGLRHGVGLDLDALARRTGFDVRTRLGPTVDRLAAAGCLEWLDDGRLRIAEGSILVTSELIVQLDEALDEALTVDPVGSATDGRMPRRDGAPVLSS